MRHIREILPEVEGPIAAKRLFQDVPVVVCFGLDQIVSAAGGNAQTVKKILKEVGWDKSNFPSDEEIREIWQNSPDFPIR
jgi:hypothetical protein